jgi:hypothetical protein
VKQLTDRTRRREAAMKMAVMDVTFKKFRVDSSK